MSRQPKGVSQPPPGCALCPRLVEFRTQNQQANPTWFNGAVPSFGDNNPRLLIVGLAPGLGGANRTGRPFTGDYAGDLLYATLKKFKFSTGTYQAHPDDGLKLKDCMIANAVRCVPPQNKPLTSEIKTCRPFLKNEFALLPNLRAIVALGRLAHDQVLTCFDVKKSANPFAHNARHQITDQLTLFDSYHCSRYNTNTHRLTTKMFEDVFKAVRAHLAHP